IVQYAKFDEQTGVSSTTYGNVGRNMELSSSLSLNGPVSKKLSVIVNATLRYNKIENKLVETQQAKGFSGVTATYLTYRPNQLFSLFGGGGVARSTYNLVNSVSSTPFYQVNVGYKFFNKKLSTTVNFNNFFSKWQSTTASTNDINFK